MLAHLFWFGEHQLERIKPFFTKAGGVSRVAESGVERQSISFAMACAGWMPHLLMDLTKPSTSVSAAGR
ncbi:MAG: hypothetical protein TH68_02865 [Candidatus Synechococcus spongiarum 142]|uniref:Uncharacterized protein n=1 Tax=Candidatus Synechococcus spongiarum 142 TaxID=1608213 RepID=A0A6N3X4N8_9SYNE|nr:MAG: hypothetical protein TH68_02865 [Candidatus Synechococcus spongiarum 142]